MNAKKIFSTLLIALSFALTDWRHPLQAADSVLLWSFMLPVAKPR
jgi:hypothetical protein